MEKSKDFINRVTTIAFLYSKNSLNDILCKKILKKLNKYEIIHKIEVDNPDIRSFLKYNSTNTVITEFPIFLIRGSNSIKPDIINIKEYRYVIMLAINLSRNLAISRGDNYVQSDYHSTTDTENNTESQSESKSSESSESSDESINENDIYDIVKPKIKENRYKNSNKKVNNTEDKGKRKVRYHLKNNDYQITLGQLTNDEIKLLTDTINEVKNI